MSTQPGASQAASEADDCASPRVGLLAMARPIFLNWELLRIPFNIILVVATILIAGLDSLFVPRIFLMVVEGAFVANFLYFAGPVAETYIRWLGVNQIWVRWGLFAAGTIMTIVVAAIELNLQLSPGFGFAKAKMSSMELTGDAQERIKAVTTQLARHTAPPTAILDAHLLKEMDGDGVLGPADYRDYCRIDVAPANVAQWTQQLMPLAAKPEHAAPANSRDWWITPEAFDSLEFYEAKPFTSRLHGWIGVSPETGRIYIYTFTM